MGSVGRLMHKPVACRNYSPWGCSQDETGADVNPQACMVCGCTALQHNQRNPPLLISLTINEYQSLLCALEVAEENSSMTDSEEYRGMALKLQKLYGDPRRDDE